jgi:uridylate kinase
MNTETIVISLGGSIIVPENIDLGFLKDFKSLIESQVERGKKFVIITGGGKIARNYTSAVSTVSNPSLDNLDWLGIAATRLNSELVRIMFGDLASSEIIMDPDAIPKTDKPIMLGGGWKPGNSSDLAAIHCAISIGSKRVINLSNIDYVYDKDPHKYAEATKIENISWTDFRKLLPTTWDPGLNAPFDPVASEMAEKEGIEVDILNGRDITNLDKCLNGEKFIGTVIK